jgi:hypothetical protein
MIFPILLSFLEGVNGGGLQKLEYLLFAGKPNGSPDRYLQESLTEALTDICRKPNGSPDRYLQERITEALTDICRKA